MLEGASDEALLPAKSAKTPQARAEAVEKQREHIDARRHGAARARDGVRRRDVVLAVRREVWARARWLPRRDRRGHRRLACGRRSGRGGIARRAATSSRCCSILWGGVLAAIEILPRSGYAKPDPNRPAWSCPAPTRSDADCAGREVAWRGLARLRRPATLRGRIANRPSSLSAFRRSQRLLG